MIDQDFCDFLEYEICKAFKRSEDKAVKGFWCDGIAFSQPDSCYSQKFVSDNREIKLKAFIGTDGQTEYELTLKLGNRALSQFAKNLDIKTCLPKPDKQNWFNIDLKRNKIEIPRNLCFCI